LSTLDAEIDDRVIKVKVTQESDLEKTELCKYSKWRNTRIYKMKGPVQLEPKSPSSLNAAEYNASRKHVETAADVPNELPESEDAHELSAAVSTLSVLTETLVAHGAKKGSIDLTESRLHIDASSIDALVMLRPEMLAMVNRLLQFETNTNCDLHSSSNSGHKVQHESLKRLGPGRWLSMMNSSTVSIHITLD
jgi:hypothetical protein